jgi:hypothetical protein
MRILYWINSRANQYYKHETVASEFEKICTFNVNLRAKQHSTIWMALCLPALYFVRAQLYFYELVEFEFRLEIIFTWLTRYLIRSNIMNILAYFSHIARLHINSFSAQMKNSLSCGRFYTRKLALISIFCSQSTRNNLNVTK